MQAAGLRWHVQVMGHGPVLLLLHGTGASTHSWRALAPQLATRFTVVAPDLPGHGFTEAPPAVRLSLPGMSWALRGLIRALALSPAYVAGHSAGAAIALRMTLDRAIASQAVVSLNGALVALRGVPGHVFAPLARLLTSVPLVPTLFAWRAADRAVVERLIRDTGSTIEPEGIDLYARLVRSPGHVAAALGMMARWDLRPLERDLPRLAVPLHLIVGSNDRTIPPSESAQVQARVRGATLTTLPGLGHLAHEERPQEVADLLIRLLLPEA